MRAIMMKNGMENEERFLFYSKYLSNAMRHYCCCCIFFSLHSYAIGFAGS